MLTFYLLLIVITLVVTVWLGLPLYFYRPWLQFKGGTVSQPLFGKGVTRKTIGCWVIVCGVPWLALPLYLGLGSSQAWRYYQQRQQQQAQVATEIARIRDPSQLITALQQHLRRYPRSPRGWYLLSLLLLKTQHYQTASIAAAHAYQLQPARTQYVLNWALTYFLANQHHLAPQIRGLLQPLLKDPATQPDALALLAMDAYYQGQYAQAVDDWEKLLTLLPVDGMVSKQLLKLIAHAQQQLSKEK